ncbi:MAG: helix-turn-helix domain-containing protein [Candidatus Eremiobacteraeota bacterium]|nr:helix-turn-helix domain-containing protein [Candidatus Eremiobacteraeota bacterium]MBV8366316.1 helix-turn-helix domain-containing protein [Candidatus Eremiobacteraeota bacterium]
MSATTPGRDRHEETASFLRSRRERLTPADVGLPSGPRRRVKGLRREEVALLADVGVTWYTWLEQGRPIAVSDETLARITAALRLNSSEAEYLRKLVKPGAEQPHIWEMKGDESVRYIVEHFKDGFAYLRNSRFDWLAWNERFGRYQNLDPKAPAIERNMLWRLFTDKNSRTLYPHWKEYAARLVAAFRAEYAEHVGDRDFEGLIESLTKASPEFSRLWTDFEVLSPAQWVVVGPFDMRDPQTGEVAKLKFDSLNLMLPEHPGQIVVFGVLP